MPLDTTSDSLTRDSYYEATACRGPQRPGLQGAQHCDVAVVGAGLAGLSAALELAQRGYRVAVLEARQVGWGASGRNGGQAIHGLACDPSIIEQQLGADAAKLAWDITIEALDLIQQRLTRHRIDADWQGGYLGLATSARKGAELARWADTIEARYSYPLQRIAPAEVPQWIESGRFHSGIHDPRSGHLHPLRYTLGLAQAAESAGVQLYEGTTVTGWQGGASVTLQTQSATGGGTLHAKRLLLAGNVYLQGLAPQLRSRIMPVGTYIACSDVLDERRCRALIPSRSAVCDTNFVLDYFRPTADHRMLYGGRVSYSTVSPMNLAASMRQRMLATFPQLRDVAVKYAWGGYVDITMNRAPDFGRLPSSPGGPDNVYYLQGFSGHGLALTGMAGRLVAEAMDGDASRFDTFARLRHHSFPGGPWLRTPALVLGMAWYRLRDLLG
ncbi:MAG: NAD(P)/FAD-dependent oxidoreductase [Rubrivivax sp.]|jgi:gamma-glutamylputrescine oxidase